MKRTLLMIIAALALSGVGCGSKSSGGAATPPAPTDPGANGGGSFQCEPWQVYNSQYGCLNPSAQCGMGMGYVPGVGCVSGVSPSEIPQGAWDNGIEVVNMEALRAMLQDMGRCYQSNCPTQSWAYLTIQVFGNNYGISGQGGGLHQLISGYPMSSAYHLQFGNNYGAPQSRRINVSLYTAGQYGSTTTLVYNNRAAYPVENGFQVITYGQAGSPAYNERVRFKFTYLNSERTQLSVQIIYQGTLVAQGTINKN